MKPITINQEILLFTNTSFSNRELSNPDTANNKPEINSYREELEKACWAGMLFEMLPELTVYSFSDCKMSIWNILTAGHFLLVNQGSYPIPIEKETSVDPHLFLHSLHFN